VTLAEPFAPSDAVAGGLIDRVVPPLQLEVAALEMATALTRLDLDAHAASKLRARRQTAVALRAAIEADYAPFAARHSGLQELARRVLRIAVPDDGDDLGRVDHGPPALALKVDHAVLADLHAGQLLVLRYGEPDVADPADHHGH
jgi:hypothetical protein